MSVNVLQQRTATEGYDVMGGGTKQPPDIPVDTTPTADSTNPVTSGGVYTALETKQDTLTFDDVPTNGSNNPVKSDGIYDALQTKQDTISIAHGTKNVTLSSSASARRVSLFTIKVPIGKTLIFSCAPSGYTRKNFAGYANVAYGSYPTYIAGNDGNDEKKLDYNFIWYNDTNQEAEVNVGGLFESGDINVTLQSTVIIL